MKMKNNFKLTQIACNFIFNFSSPMKLTLLARHHRMYSFAKSRNEKFNNPHFHL